MVIQHNLQALNSYRMMGITNSSQAKSTEKLSSGYKINRAADDAAGLAISEKMRRQIRGLTQASLNCQDGISLVQIADGALNEVHDMLHRCSELSVKAANGTLTDMDRSYIQSEVDQIVSEIDKIAERTTFNEIPVLQG
ncbi:MAG: flagellar hook protein, partial [Lachnospiraceae bacterium]|nr:flagellar hook protein [Lachnospiraceae bacterium]